MLLCLKKIFSRLFLPIPEKLLSSTIPKKKKQTSKDHLSLLCPKTHQTINPGDFKDEAALSEHPLDLCAHEQEDEGTQVFPPGCTPPANLEDRYQ